MDIHIAHYNINDGKRRQAIIEYNRNSNRPFRVVPSDKRRYKAFPHSIAVSSLCNLSFADMQNYNEVCLHCCEVSELLKASQIYITAKHIWP